MLRNLLVYGLMVAMLVVVAGLIGRLLGVPPARRPNGAILANPWADAECAFDQALAEHKRRRYAALLTGRAARLELPRLDETRLTRRPLGEQVVPVREVVGTVDGTARAFDREFRPTCQRARDRFQRVFVAMSRGEELPPIELFRWQDRYYVSDGHHRVAAARAMGLDGIAGHVTDLVGPSAE